MPIVVAAPEDLLTRIGQPLGVSEWHPVTQPEVDHFAAGTGNRAPIHVDPEFARGTPLGTTIAFGVQILAMATMLLGDVWELRNLVNGADYGANRVRYPAPVPVGARIRLHATLGAAEPVEDRGVRATLDLVFELEGSDRPACVAQIVFVYWFSPVTRV
ncbi:MAG TPA: MaoC family dehydratase [Gemmatimonadales bacterium]|nr:MaoC family dehydratase [Gemmatimonadales bacterium]